MNMDIEDAGQTQARHNQVAIAHNQANRAEIRQSNHHNTLFRQTLIFASAVVISTVLLVGCTTPRPIPQIKEATRAAIIAQTPAATIPGPLPTTDSTGYGIDRLDIFGFLVSSEQTWYDFQTDSGGSPKPIPIYGYDKMNNTLIIIDTVQFGYPLKSIGIVSDTSDPTGQIKYVLFIGSYTLNGQNYTTFYVDEQFVTVHNTEQ